MKAKSNSTSLVKNKNSSPTMEKTARIIVRSKKTRRGGESFFRMLEEIAANTLKGCVQDLFFSARRSTSCLNGRALASASDLNWLQRSSSSIPAVRRRQPSCERQTPRRMADFAWRADCLSLSSLVSRQIRQSPRSSLGEVLTHQYAR